MTTKDQMLKARGLIHAQRYNEARAILQTIDHPTAKAWLVKLDNPPRPPKPSRKWQVVVAVTIAVGLVAAAIVIGLSSASTDTSPIGRLFSYCLAVAPAENISECRAWYPVTFESRHAQVTACHRASPELDQPFYECLSSEHIDPPGIVRR